MQEFGRKKMIVVGDKVLVIPDSDQDRTDAGLYLPPTVREKEKVQSGYVVNVGPGYPVPNPNFIEQESWSTTPKDPVKYIPLQVEEGDSRSPTLHRQVYDVSESTQISSV